MVQRIIIDTVATTADTRVLKGTAIEDLYDFGLADIIMAIVTPQQWSVKTLGAILQKISDDLIEQYPNTVAVLDRHTLERFIRDMALNGYDIAFSDELPIGKRPLEATISNITPSNGSATINAIVNPNDSVSKLWVYWNKQSGGNGELMFDVTPDIGGSVQVEMTGIPADNYTIRIAGINGDGLRGFRSDESLPFSVT